MDADDIPYDVSWSFDERGRDVPHAPDEMRAAVGWLRSRAGSCDDPRQQARLLSLAGGYARMTGDLDDAVGLLREASSLAAEIGDARLEAIIGIRLGHAHHWRGEFAGSNALFESLLARCRADDRLANLVDFALQHHGKSLLDEGRVADALARFEEALELRRAKGDADLIASTELALAAARAAEPGAQRR